MNNKVNWKAVIVTLGILAFCSLGWWFICTIITAIMNL